MSQTAVLHLLHCTLLVVCNCLLWTEREQNRNQATADITRPSSSSSSIDQSRVSLPANANLVVNTHSQTYLDTTSASASSTSSSANVSTGTQTSSAESSDDETSTLTGECCEDVAHEHRGKKRCAQFTVQQNGWLCTIQCVRTVPCWAVYNSCIHSQMGSSYSFLCSFRFLFCGFC